MLGIRATYILLLCHAQGGFLVHVVKDGSSYRYYQVFKKGKREGKGHTPLSLWYNLETHTSLMLIAHVSVTKSSYMVASSSMGGLVMGSLAMYPAELCIF